MGLIGNLVVCRPAIGHRQWGYIGNLVASPFQVGHLRNLVVIHSFCRLFRLANGVMSAIWLSPRCQVVQVGQRGYIGNLVVMQSDCTGWSYSAIWLQRLQVVQVGQRGYIGNLVADSALAFRLARGYIGNLVAVKISVSKAVQFSRPAKLLIESL